MQSQSKSQEVLFVEIEKLILKFVWRGKDPEYSIQYVKNKVGGLVLSDFNKKLE